MRHPWLRTMGAGLAIVALASPTGRAQVGPGRGPGGIDPSSPFSPHFRGLSGPRVAYYPTYSSEPAPAPRQAVRRPAPSLHQFYPGMRLTRTENVNVPWNHPLGRPHCTPSRYGR